MKISIDLDGVLWHNQTFFRSLMRGLKEDGHLVGILTSHKIIHEFADRALMEKRGFPCPDFYIGRPMDSKGIEYDVLKSLAIKEHGIDLHFEDGDSNTLRNLMGDSRYKIISMVPRGKEDEHFE